jgi:rare lipoprotein A
MQIGAFAQRNNADKLVAEIQRYTSDPVQIKTGTSNSQPIYRVQIGPMRSVDDSDTLHAQLHKHQLGNPITVIN